MAKKQRSDAERRLRQCERLGRLLQVLQLIAGKGRWDAEGIAQELECSRRTVYRLLQTLSMAGVPWYFDETARAYRVRPGYRLPSTELASRTVEDSHPAKRAGNIQELIQDAEELLGQLSQKLTDLKSEI